MKRKEKKKKKPKELLEAVRANRMVYVLISPFFILYAIFGLYPMVYSFLLSFFKWSGSGEKEFVGFLNYQYLFKDAVFLKSVVNTLIIWCLSTIPMVIFAFILNLGTLKCKSVFRAVYFLPNVTSTVAVAIVFATMFASNYGLVNFLLTSLGMDPVKWMSVPFWVQFVIALVVMWRWTGYNMVFYLSGLQNIEYSVYEAAKIDGANGWKTFWGITVPLLKPTIIMTFIMSINGTLQLFDESVNLTKGGPANTTITMSHYVYNTCFINVPNFGYASAMAFLIFIMVAILAFINLKVGDTRD